MKNLIPRLVGALAALMVVTLVPPGDAAHAKRLPPPVMQFIGYQIQVEPEIVEPVRGRLMTRALIWKFRAVFENRRTGQRAHVLTSLRGAQDSRVRVRRPWEPSDEPRVSRLFLKERKALRRFSGLRNSPDITLLGSHTPPPVVDPLPTPPPQPTLPPPPSCREVLLKKGHSAVHLSRCKGVDPYCAVAVLRAGHSPVHLSRCSPADLEPMCVDALMAKRHSPMHLDRCRKVHPECAARLLEAGHSPVHLSRCKTPDLSRRCVKHLLGKGHSPVHIDRCKGVDGRCAKVLLQQGQSPVHLSKCKR